ncbi:MAG TPA: cation diffusion facilitator family transporter [Bacillota bacterium]|nr:cation diffusion facilitator family transporter [Bacillota bacterium]HPA55268.1 cation diffusion facilitator family transporter [Bacillota bacterium]HPX68563.1 cation diffusion facilitator family transporter [Bacillota bacterium]HQA65810.1 cation diffusion facilitator family transporter [Bacillota bacterium]HQO42173.1 cation diffusion facilitator family transporter [Bacillota bacterium]
MLTDILIKSFIKDKDNIRDKSVRQKYGYLGGFVGIACNVMLSGAKIAIGLMINSIAITADAVNNLSDAASSIIMVIGFKITSKPADREHPFGHGRIEYISAMVVSFMVILAGFEFFKGSFDRIRNPETVKFEIIPFSVLLLSIGVKVWLSRFYKKISREIDSKAMEASAADSLSDVTATSVVALSLLASLWTTFPLDGYVGLLVSALIIYSGISLTKDTLNPLLGEAPEPKFIRSITEKVLSYDGIIGIHDMIVHNYGPGRCVVSLHAEIPASMDIMKAHDVIDLAEQEISEEMDIHMVIHMDPINTDDEVVQKTQEQITGLINEMHEELTIHDFRIVGGEEHKNLIFDLVVPFEYDEKMAGDLSKKVAWEIKSKYPECNAIIYIDRAYSVLDKL